MICVEKIWIPPWSMYRDFTVLCKLKLIFGNFFLELQVFHDFMAKLFEDQIVNHFHSLNVNKTMLTSRYKEAVQMLKKIR